MRFAITALAALCLSMPVQAATIVQLANTSGSGFLWRFDPTLGHLDTVTLDVNLTSRRGFFRVSGQPQGTPADVNVAWSIDGLARIDLPLLGTAGLTTVSIPIAGVGSSVVSPISFLYISATGTASFDLDPGFMTLAPQPSPSVVIFRPYADGLYDPSLDTVLTPEFPLNLVNNAECETGIGNEACTQGFLTLTYNYTPVPEPATWAMMLGGLGLVGAEMRRRRTSAAAARTPEMAT